MVEDAEERSIYFRLANDTFRERKRYVKTS